MEKQGGKILTIVMWSQIFKEWLVLPLESCKYIFEKKYQKYELSKIFDVHPLGILVPSKEDVISSLG